MPKNKDQGRSHVGAMALIFCLSLGTLLLADSSMDHSSTEASSAHVPKTNTAPGHSSKSKTAAPAGLTGPLTGILYGNGTNADTVATPDQVAAGLTGTAAPVLDLSGVTNLDIPASISAGGNVMTFPASAGTVALFDSTGALPTGAISSTAVTNAGLTADIWIAIRTDGKTGSGTQNDPYDGSTEAKFDAIVGPGKLPSTGAVNVHLMAGTYTTTGVRLDYQSSLQGAGIDKTIILYQGAQALPAYFQAVIWNSGTTTPTSTPPSCTVSDLTVNGNATAQTAPAFCIGAVAVNGYILRVKAINCGTNVSATHEAFWLYEASSYTAGQAYGFSIKDCIVIAPTTGYNTFITAGGGNSNATGPITVAAVNVVISGNVVVTATPGTTANGHAITTANCATAIIEDNYVDGIQAGYYQDTWSNHNTIIRNNTFNDIGITAQGLGIMTNGPSWTSGSYSASISGLQIYENKFFLSPSSGAFNAAVYLYGNTSGGLVKNISIHDNTIDYIPYVSTSGDGDRGIDIQPSAGINANARVYNNTINLIKPGTWLVSSDGPYGVIGRNFVDYDNNHDGHNYNVVGRNRSRGTFVVPSAGWYTLVEHTNFGARTLQGTAVVRVRSVYTGSGTLSSPGTCTVSDTNTLANSRIVLTRTTPGGTCGDLYVSSWTAGTGFTVSSTNPNDTSSFAYQMDNNTQGNCYTIGYQQPDSAVPGYVTQFTSEASISGNTEATMTKVGTYGNSSQNLGLVYLVGYFPGPCLVTDDVDNADDYSLWDHGQIGVSVGAPSYSITLDPTKQLATNGGMMLASISGTGSAPTSSAVSAGGGGSSGTCTVQGNNLCGDILLTTGSTTPTASSTIVTLTFANSLTFPTHSVVILYPSNANAAGLASTAQPYTGYGSGTAVTFTSNTTPLAASTQYVWHYVMSGY